MEMGPLKTKQKNAQESGDHEIYRDIVSLTFLREITGPL